MHGIDIGEDIRRSLGRQPEMPSSAGPLRASDNNTLAQMLACFETGRPSAFLDHGTQIPFPDHQRLSLAELNRCRSA
jgi:hypothetical protein